jgi:putative tricarboxylic transport membrane protein
MTIGSMRTFFSTLLMSILLFGCSGESTDTQSASGTLTQSAGSVSQASSLPDPSDRSISIMAPAAPGGGWDQTARTLQAVIQENNLIGNVQVMNVPGAGGTIGLAQVVNSQQGNKDYLMVNGLIMMGAILTNQSAVTLDQVTPIARLIGEYEVMVVPADSPYQTLNEFIEAWKLDPGAMSIAGGSAGGTDHMLTGLLAQAVGVDVAKVNYLPHSGGGESLASLLGSHVAAGINGFAELESFIESGRLRALALSSDERVEGLEIPTFVEQGIDVTLANWRAVAAPSGITAEQKADLVALVDQIYNTQTWRDALVRNNWIDLYMKGPEYEDFLQKEAVRVKAVLRSIGLVE